MEEIIMYRAEDGTCFEEKEDCVQYEATQALDFYFAQNEIIALDCHKNLITLNSLIDDEFDSMFYFYCATDESADTLNEVFTLMDIETDPFKCHDVKKGFYAWVEDNDEWRILEDDIEIFSNRWDWINNFSQKQDTTITQFGIKIHIS